MLKRLSIILLFCLVGVFAFAQTAAKQVLSEKDITSFITNYKQIMVAFDTLGDKYDHLFEGIDPNGGFESMVKMRSIKVPAEIEDILRKNGLGNNGFEKSMIIIQGVGVLLMEEDLDMLTADAASKDPKIAASIKEAREGMKILKDSINSKDIDLINKKKEELFTLIQE